MLQSARLTVYGFGRMLRPEPMNELTAVSPRMADDQKGSPAFIPDCASAASEAPIRLHGNSAPRRAAAKLRADLEAHCGGHPSATQAAIIVQAAELKLRLAVMDQEFIRTGHRSAYASRDYLAWSNSLVRLLRQLGLQGVPERPLTLAERLALARAHDAASAVPATPHTPASPTQPSTLQRAAAA
jgi:hypothetical protein